MPRVKRGTIALKKRRKIMKLAKGYRGARHKRIKSAREAVIHALTYSFRDRRAKKRDFRKLWIIRINAAARQNGLSYSRFISGLKSAGVTINRKMLADLAVTDAQAFQEFANLAKKHCAAVAS
ncbi:MAG: 50S ribosomal protein L20 [Candidatus Eremiobacteraeota bacterium]|nr:50S ribosomal protein L20 [Candidatus Eremiobacteraeota bacterium]